MQSGKPSAILRNSRLLLTTESSTESFKVPYIVPTRNKQTSQNLGIDGPYNRTEASTIHKELSRNNLTSGLSTPGRNIKGRVRPELSIEQNNE
jgi:hypothetical protein